MKPFARTNKFIRFLLVGCLLAPTFLLGQDEEEETPAEKQSAKDSLQSISIGGLDANPSKTLELVEVLRSTGKIDINTYVEAVSAIEDNPSKTLEHIEVLVSTGKIDNETFAKAIVAIIPNEDKVEAYVEELKASGKVPATVINEVIEEITNIEVPPAPPSVLPPTAPPTNPDDSYSYDTNTDTLSIYLSTSPTQNLKGADITEDKLLELITDGKLPASDIDKMTSKTIPYLVDAYELGNFSGSFHSERFNVILLEAVKLANVLIRSLEMTDKLDIAGSDNLFDKNRLTEILDNRNPYFHQLVRVLANRGAFGDKSDGKVGDAIGKLITSLFPSGVSTNEISQVLSKTMKEIVFEQLTNGDLGGLIDLSDFKNSSLFDINVDQVKGIVAQDINLGSASGSTSIDLTKQLETSNTPTDPKNWKVFGIGAGKDIIVKGDVSFKNSNRHSKTGNVVKDHALAIGALDEIHFHSKTIEKDWGLSTDFLEKHLDYSGPTQTTGTDQTAFANRTDRIKIDFEGANLYLGSISKMELVNVDLESGGNLGVASLDELHIVSSDPTGNPNTFTVGKNTNPSDRGDNIQLFANERIVADGLRFDGRVDSIYMEATTVDLKNVTFPRGSEVNLASRDGGVGGKYPTFGIGQRAVGKVNFIDQVKYDTNHINSQNSFDALGKLPNGKHPITISKR
ncbi:hypothetical protein N9D63_05835 [Opitutales bacterium]|nr:hypothetical protein [Opitutales bacterium]